MPSPAIVSVDDEPEVLRAVERDLRRKYGKDYRVLGVDSGTAAVDLLRQMKREETALRCCCAISGCRRCRDWKCWGSRCSCIRRQNARC